MCATLRLAIGSNTDGFEHLEADPGNEKMDEGLV